MLNIGTRKCSVILVLLLVLAEIGTGLFSYSGSGFLATVLTIVSSTIIIALVVQLIVQKGDRVFRLLVLIPLLGYITFKLWILVEFLTQVD